MFFDGPETADYDNVTSLNAAFLELLRSSGAACRCVDHPPPKQLDRLRRLGRRQIDRLSRVPFLLFSFRERDDHYWDSLLQATRERDLFAVPRHASDDRSCLIAAGLGFVWQLARRNPYAARLISGASVHWCELIGEHTFFHVLAAAGMRDDLLLLRAADKAELWEKLLRNGVSDRRAIRQAARISALQSVLTRTVSSRGAWAAAACRARPAALRVANTVTRDRSAREPPNRAED